MSFKLTYSTMFDPPEELHTRFEAALGRARAKLGARHDHFIGGTDRQSLNYRDTRSPIDREILIGSFAEGTEADAAAAMDAAGAAWPAWRAIAPPDRNRILRRAGDLIEERVYDIAAAVALEVGKNRMEALGEVQETAEFFRYYCDEYERQRNFDHALPEDPLKGYRSRNRSVMKPYGTWIVIAPFNFPFALAGGPAAAALVTGNTVVLKGATDTPWAGRLLADCLRDAGVPAGVFNYVLGTGRQVGQALLDHPRAAGVTFTGSHEIGMKILRQFSGGRVPRPCIAEMGGKNPVIVTAGADLERAAIGIVRSAFGMGGQKCSALSRIYVESPVADALIGRLADAVRALRIGDPTVRENWLGPLISESARSSHGRYAAELESGGARIVAAADLPAGAGDRGWYCAPIIAETPIDHPLWRHEMFAPIATLARVPDRETAMRLCNASDLALTAGFYGGRDEVDWFLDRIEAGVTYVNRPQGATTGAWPGYQPFGGWKGSGSTGKGIASYYYLAQYLREQSQTVVD
jgi:1-pyrroline-5-carboxylate dehydrogenase